jgi:hypothetical protein
MLFPNSTQRLFSLTYLSQVESDKYFNYLTRYFKYKVIESLELQNRLKMEEKYIVD